MTAYSEIRLREEGRYHDISDPSATLTGKELGARNVVRKAYHVELSAETAGTDYVVSCLAVPASQFPNGAKVVEIKFRSSVAVTESTTVFNTYTFSSRDVDGVNALTAATMTTDTVANGGIGTTVAHKEYSATLSATAANLVIPAGGSLSLARTHASTGTAVPRGSSFDIVIEAL